MAGGSLPSRRHGGSSPEDYVFVIAVDLASVRLRVVDLPDGHPVNWRRAGDLTVRDFAAKLKAWGKPSKVILTAIMALTSVCQKTPRQFPIIQTFQIN